MEKVEQMFALANEFSSTLPKGLEWLHALKEDACSGSNSWMHTLNGYVAGLWVSGVISIEQLDDFDKLKADD